MARATISPDFSHESEARALIREWRRAATAWLTQPKDRRLAEGLPRKPMWFGKVQLNVSAGARHQGKEKAEREAGDAVVCCHHRSG
jgi:hypothetical protein